ncbi:MAG: phosphoribosylformylglycinamidine cyclo-ligase [Planctomycetota bacterium]|nr:phosphoribosylformylglycinamidine cyclo-ligase [Planctomycetota bacterium]
MSARKPKSPPTPLTYQDAGLDLELYDQAMERLPALMKRTHTPRVMDLPGGFAGLFRLGNSRRFAVNYEDPVLVSGTDGVGTKLKVAAKLGVYNTVGIDLVAMSVNDCLCLGAEPLFFLDYLALPKDDPDLISQVVAGVVAGCTEAGCALLGGETAIMPDIYSKGDLDLAGFCVGVVERKRIVDGSAIRPKDVVLGLESSGFHSNGYSLVRKAVFDVAGLKVDDLVPELNQTVGDALLTPTRIYVKPVVDLLSRKPGREAVRGLAHITGGGIAGNLERILPIGCRVEIDRNSWTPPAMFGWLQGLGNIDREEMFRVFNMGIGFVLVVRPRSVDSVIKRLAKHNVAAHRIGVVGEGDRGVTLLN